MRLTLYQFPISHYCEKARWAMEYKGLEYETVNLLPGEHRKVITGIAPKSEVPVIKHGQNIVQGSGEIISYLDNTFSEKPLTPKDPSLRQQALEWERYVDEQVGPHVRLYCYHHLLDQPRLVLPLLTHGQAWHKRLVFRLSFAQVRVAMRKFMHINSRTAEIALKKMRRAIEKLNQQLEADSFLCGDQFSRADLAAAALFAPLRFPEKYGLKWPKQLPTALRETMDTLEPKLTWVDRLYQDYR